MKQKEKGKRKGNKVGERKRANKQEIKIKRK
jgi:hypothetical protein